MAALHQQGADLAAMMGLMIKKMREQFAEISPIKIIPGIPVLDRLRKIGFGNIIFHPAYNQLVQRDAGGGKLAKLFISDLVKGFKSRVFTNRGKTVEAGLADFENVPATANLRLICDSGWRVSIQNTHLDPVITVQPSTCLP